MGWGCSTWAARLTRGMVTSAMAAAEAKAATGLFMTSVLEFAAGPVLGGPLRAAVVQRCAAATGAGWAMAEVASATSGMATRAMAAAEAREATVLFMASVLRVARRSAPPTKE